LNKITPEFSPLTPKIEQTPNVNQWYLTQVATVPEEIAPMMLAQGYEVVNYWPAVNLPGISSPASFGMRRTSLRNPQVVRDMLEKFTEAYNEGRSANETRYEDIIRIYTEMFDKSQDEMEIERDKINGEIVVHMTTLDRLEADYSDFFDEVRGDLNNLDFTMEADKKRVQDQFDSLVAASGQQLASRGFYSSALLASITAGIEERRALALTEISERLQRLRADVLLRKNQLYVDVLKMRAGLIETKLSLTDRKREFLRYRLDTRNNMLVSLLGFVERREDSYPGLGAMAQLASSLGESGSSAWRSA
jgi:hypothetical protein